MAYDVMIDEDEAVVLPCRHTEEGVQYVTPELDPWSAVMSRRPGPDQLWRAHGCRTHAQDRGLPAHQFSVVVIISSFCGAF